VKEGISRSKVPRSRRTSQKFKSRCKNSSLKICLHSMQIWGLHKGYIIRVNRFWNVSWLFNVALLTSRDFRTRVSRRKTPNRQQNVRWWRFFSICNFTFLTNKPLRKQFGNVSLNISILKDFWWVLPYCATLITLFPCFIAWHPGNGNGLLN